MSTCRKHRWLGRWQFLISTCSSMTTIPQNCDNSMLFCQRMLILLPLEAKLKQCKELLKEKGQQFRKSMYARRLHGLYKNKFITFCFCMSTNRNIGIRNIKVLWWLKVNSGYMFFMSLIPYFILLMQELCCSNCSVICT